MTQASRRAALIAGLVGSTLSSLAPGTAAELCGASSFMVLLQDGQLTGWGSTLAVLGGFPEPYGSYIGDVPEELGEGLPLIDIGITPNVVAAGGSRVCAADLSLPASRALKCWGRCQGRCGQGPTESTVSAPSPELPFTDLGFGELVDVQLGLLHSCALFKNGGVKCWGEIFLGYGDETFRGDQAGEMGNALPFVDFGPGVAASQLAAGSYHTCAVLVDEISVKCWGFRYLGYGDLGSRGTVPDQMGTALPSFALGGRILKLAAGGDFTCAHLEGGVAKCWGDNSVGQLGNGGPSDVPVLQAGPELVALDFGNDKRILQLEAGRDFACALLDVQPQNEVVCWGNNNFGQLGRGSDIPNSAEQAVSAAKRVDFGGGGRAVEISTTATTACVRLAWPDSSDLDWRCWGYNLDGNLGRGHLSESVGRTTMDMGGFLAGIDLGPFNPEPTAAPSRTPTTLPTSRPTQTPTSRPTATAAGDLASDTEGLDALADMPTWMISVVAVCVALSVLNCCLIAWQVWRRHANLQAPEQQSQRARRPSMLA